MAEGNLEGSTIGIRVTSNGSQLHHSLSPTRNPGGFNNSSRLVPSYNNVMNSEISDYNKRMSLHTYHIRNKNGSPTA